jgi:hypothetical protein
VKQRIFGNVYFVVMYIRVEQRQTNWLAVSDEVDFVSAALKLKPDSVATTLPPKVG